MPGRLAGKIALDHRRLARHRRRGRRAFCRARARISCWRRAPSAGSKRSTTRFAPPAAAPRWCRSTCATSSRSTSSPRRSIERYGRLDILVGNAAEFGTFSPLGHIDPKLWGEIIDLNLTANWRLIRAMDPLLRAAPDGRAIFVTSGIARDPRAYWGPYAVSKAGLEVLVQDLRRRDREDRGARQPDRAGRRAHPAARPRLSRRRPDDPAAAGERRRRLPRSSRCRNANATARSSTPRSRRHSVTGLGFGSARTGCRPCAASAGSGFPADRNPGAAR